MKLRFSINVDRELKILLSRIANKVLDTVGGKKPDDILLVIRASVEAEQDEVRKKGTISKLKGTGSLKLVEIEKLKEKYL